MYTHIHMIFIIMMMTILIATMITRASPLGLGGKGRLFSFFVRGNCGRVRLSLHAECTGDKLSIL